MPQATGLNIPLVTVRFAFSKPDLIPLCVKEKERKEERIERRPGLEVITPTEQISAIGLLDQLELEGYILTTAFYQNRTHPHNPGRIHYAVQFIFALPEEGQRPAKDEVRAALQTLCNQAFWRVRAFQNPFYSKGQIVEGSFAMSINLEARVPRFEAGGKPVLARKKDSGGRTISDPVPIEEKGTLVIIERKPLIIFR